MTNKTRKVYYFTMQTDTKDFYKRIQELSQRSYLNSQFCFTNFLTMGELSDFYTQLSFSKNHEFNISPCAYTVSGGYDNFERGIIRFGDPEELMYEQPFPIECLKISPLNKKFSDELNHRDYLGSIMNLGIDRSLIGDFIIKNGDCYIFVLDSISDYIIKELCRIKHTSVICERCDTPDKLLSPEYEELLVMAKSIRIDGIIAKLTKLSRSKTAELFLAKKIFVNGKLMENESYQLKEKDVISIRGFGKYIYEENSGSTRKGNLVVKILRYV